MEQSNGYYSNSHLIQPISFEDANSQKVESVHPVGRPAYNPMPYVTAAHQMNGGQYFANPEVLYYSQRSVDSFIRMKEAEYKSALVMQQQGFIFEKRKELEDKKLQNALKREEGMELRKRKREMASHAIFENAEGYLCLEVSYCDGEKEYSKPVISKPRIRATRICNIDSKETEVCIIRAEHVAGQIILSGKDINVKNFGKEIQRKGISIESGRDNRKMHLEMIFSYLMDTAKVVFLPEAYGWYRLNNKEWQFAEEEAMTIAGAKEGRYEE